MQTPNRGNPALAILLVVLALGLAAAAVFYATTETSLLASSTARHYKHAALAGGLAVVCLVGASFARRRP